MINNKKAVKIKFSLGVLSPKEMHDLKLDFHAKYSILLNKQNTKTENDKVNILFREGVWQNGCLKKMVLDNFFVVNATVYENSLSKIYRSTINGEIEGRNNSTILISSSKIVDSKILPYESSIENCKITNSTIKASKYTPPERLTIIENCNAVNSSIYGAYITSCSIKNCIVENCTIISPTMTNCYVHDSLIKDGRVDKSKLINSNAVGVTVSQCLVNGGGLGDTTIDNSKCFMTLISKCECKHSVVSNSKIRSKSTWENGTLSNSMFYDSIWMSGYWKNGSFLNSLWFSGTWNVGTIFIDISKSDDIHLSRKVKVYCDPVQIRKLINNYKIRVHISGRRLFFKDKQLKERNNVIEKIKKLSEMCKTTK